MFTIPFQPNYEAFLANIRRCGTPQRVYNVELAVDVEIMNAIDELYDVSNGLDRADSHFGDWRQIRLLRFLGYDYVPIFPHLNILPIELYTKVTDDTSKLVRAGGRSWFDESNGPIQTWEDFESADWSDPWQADTTPLEWLEKHVPDDMCIMAGCSNVFEFTTWVMGYERLCYAIYDQPDLVDAIITKVGEYLYAWCQILMQFNRIQFIFEGDDMGFKTSTMVAADFLKEKILSWHAKLADLCHQNNRVYCLHSCGNIEAIMEALIEDVNLDGLHSFEDIIEPVTIAKKRWGNRIALLGGIDMDFICRATSEQVRKRVRETLDICLPGGGYCLGTGNTVANYIPVENYLAMLDEGRRYCA